MERYFAKIENNIVTTVIVADYEFVQNIEGFWLECGNNSGRNRASSGYFYISNKDNFAPQKPFNSWSLNNDCIWEAPNPYPEDGNEYYWNEETLTWELITIIDNEEI